MFLQSIFILKENFMGLSDFARSKETHLRYRRESEERARKASQIGHTLLDGYESKPEIGVYEAVHPLHDDDGGSGKASYAQTPFTSFEDTSIAVRGFLSEDGKQLDGVFQLIVGLDNGSAESEYATVVESPPDMQIHDNRLKTNGDVWDAERETVRAFEAVEHDLK